MRVIKLEVPVLISGIYFLMDGKLIKYIGSSINVASRVAQHVGNSKQFTRVEVYPYQGEDLRSIERCLIKLFKPSLNTEMFARCRPTESDRVEATTFLKNFGMVLQEVRGKVHLRKISKSCYEEVQRICVELHQRGKLFR